MSGCWCDWKWVESGRKRAQVHAERWEHINKAPKYWKRGFWEARVAKMMEDLTFSVSITGHAANQQSANGWTKGSACSLLVFIYSIIMLRSDQIDFQMLQYVFSVSSIFSQQVTRITHIHLSNCWNVTKRTSAFVFSVNCSQPYLLKFRFNSSSATITHRELTITTYWVKQKRLISVLVFRLGLHINAGNSDIWTNAKLDEDFWRNEHSSNLKRFL